jgi:hypothetical protein
MVIYNEAGEAVRNLYTTVAAPVSAGMSSINLSAAVFYPYSANPPTGTVLTITDTQGGTVALTWDGRDDQGAIVTTGRYFLSVHWDNGEGGEQTITKVVTVMDQGVPTGLVSAWPNLLKGRGASTLFVSSQASLTLYIRIYDLAGERVDQVWGPAGTSQAVWNADQAASGLYLAVVELTDGAGHNIALRTLKLAVRH